MIPTHLTEENSRRHRCFLFELDRFIEWAEELKRSEPCDENTATLRALREAAQLQGKKNKRKALEGRKS